MSNWSLFVLFCRKRTHRKQETSTQREQTGKQEKTQGWVRVLMSPGLLTRSWEWTPRAAAGGAAGAAAGGAGWWVRRWWRVSNSHVQSGYTKAQVLHTWASGVSPVSHRLTRVTEVSEPLYCYKWQCLDLNSGLWSSLRRDNAQAEADCYFYSHTLLFCIFLSLLALVATLQLRCRTPGSDKNM